MHRIVFATRLDRIKDVFLWQLNMAVGLSQDKQSSLRIRKELAFGGGGVSNQGSPSGLKLSSSSCPTSSLVDILLYALLVSIGTLQLQSKALGWYLLFPRGE